MAADGLATEAIRSSSTDGQTISTCNVAPTRPPAILTSSASTSSYAATANDTIDTTANTENLGAVSPVNKTSNVSFSLKLHVLSVFSHKKYGIQPTLITKISNNETNESENVRLLIDPGSNVSFISRNVADRLGLQGPTVEVALNVAAGQRVNTLEREVSFVLGNTGGAAYGGVANATEFSIEIFATTLKKIGNPLPKIDFNPNTFKHLKNLIFTEKYPSTHKRALDVLLGEPYALRLVKRLVSGRLYQPSALLTPSVRLSVALTSRRQLTT